MKQKRDLLFFKIFDALYANDLKKTWELLDKTAKEHPEYINDPSYMSAKSMAAYKAKDYKTAYYEADKVVKLAEKMFAPKKPYEMAAVNEHYRNDMYTMYLNRYQALMSMGNFKAALNDINNALKAYCTPGALVAKASILMKLNRIKESAFVLNEAYDKNKYILKDKENYKRKLCGEFYANGEKNVDICSDYFKILENEKENKGDNQL